MNVQESEKYPRSDLSLAIIEIEGAIKMKTRIVQSLDVADYFTPVLI